MRASRFLLATQKETPADAEVISHQLMLRAGMVRKVASGLYNWLPLGLRVLKKVEGIVREEMDKVGALEVLMPVVQPSEIWEESGRWQQYGSELLRINDRHNRSFCLGPTHEEVITDLVRNEISSYKQLPACLYQVQTKFRDEVRPRFGVMRAREFLMKDAYSFHINHESLEQTYAGMHQAYCDIFDRIGLDYRPVLADTGSIGGTGSHEFHVLAQSGEDDIAFSTHGPYAANIELAEAVAPKTQTDDKKTAQEVATPAIENIEDVATFFKISPSQTVKTLLVKGVKDDNEQETCVALCLRGDHTLNDIKATKITCVAEPLEFLAPEKVKNLIGAEVGSIGPVDLKITRIVDRAAAALVNFVCGANKTGYHLQDANWEDNITVEDIRNVVQGDPSPDGNGTLSIKRGIEVGHIFQLGTKYSTALNANVLDENGKETPMTMGCYGIGVSRIVAAAIEQNHDENGIIWPEAIAPFQLAIVPINLHKSEQVKHACEDIYTQLTQLGIDVIFMDEPKARLGSMLANIELIGIPHRIVIGDRGLENGAIEYRSRSEDENQEIALGDVVNFLKQKLTND